MKTLRIGLLGLGQVGTGLYEMLARKKKFVSDEVGVCLDVVKVAVKNKSKKRKVRIPKSV